MKTQTYLHLDNPCNENWHKMTPVDKGKFCDACATQVMDFTTMTDAQILHYLNINNGKMCGRIHRDQLDRALHSSEQKKKGIQFLVAGLASLFFSIGKSSAQNKPEKELPKSVLLNSNHNFQASEKSLQQFSQTIKGRIISDEEENLLNAYVVNPLSHEKIFANKKGSFVMQVSNNVDELLVGAKGFNTRVVPLATFNTTDTTIVLSASDTTITNISGFDKGDLNGTNIIMGGIRSFSEEAKTDTVITFVKRIFNNAFFKIIPNPASKDGVSISIKQSGNYTVQIFDNNSKLVHSQEVVVNSKGEIVRIVFPNCINKGTYYIRVIDKKTKKQYVDKLLVQ